MRVVHISTHDSGGAAAAAHRLHNGLIDHGVQSQFLVLYNSGKYEDTLTFQSGKHHFWWKKIQNRLSQDSPPELNTRIEIFTSPLTLYDVLSDPRVQEADVIHLHWVANFIDYKTFFQRNKKPLVWTFHDMNPFLGGFHYGIDRTFASPDLLDLEKKYEDIKLNALERLRCSVVAPSAWLRHEVSISPFGNIFKDIQVIPYGVDPTMYYSANQNNARARLGLNGNAILILIVATNLNAYRKGFDIVIEVMKNLEASGVEFLVVGNIDQPVTGRNIHTIGTVGDPSKLNLLYNAADAVLLSSREDNLPNVMIESLMCGTPVIGFAVGGIRETIVPGRDGLLTEVCNVEGLVKLVEQFCAQRASFDRTAISNRARAKFEMPRQTNEVTNLYTRVIKAEA